MNRVAVVIVNWNGIQDTLECFKSVLKQNSPGFEFHIVVVDNGSEQVSVLQLQKLAPKYPEKLSVLYNTTNTGFTGGVNTGIRWAIDHYYAHVALINNDAVCDDNWLSHLTSAIERDETIGAVTGLLLRSDGLTIDTTGEAYSSWGMAFPTNRNKPVEKAPRAGEVFAATGGATLFRVAMFYILIMDHNNILVIVLAGVKSIFKKDDIFDCFIPHLSNHNIN